MLIHPGFDPVAVRLGPLSVHWYGLMYVAAFVQFLWLGRRHLLRRPDLTMTPDLLDDLMFWGVLGVVLGGRLGYVLFYKPLDFVADPASIVAVWQGGMSFHGGFLGVLLAVAWLAQRRGLRARGVRVHGSSWRAPMVPPPPRARKPRPEMACYSGSTSNSSRPSALRRA